MLKILASTYETILLVMYHGPGVELQSVASFLALHVRGVGGERGQNGHSAAKLEANLPLHVFARQQIARGAECPVSVLVS